MGGRVWRTRTKSDTGVRRGEVDAGEADGEADLCQIIFLRLNRKLDSYVASSYSQLFFNLIYGPYSLWHYTGNSNINKGRVDFVLVLAPF